MSGKQEKFIEYLGIAETLRTVKYEIIAIIILIIIIIIIIKNNVCY